MSDQQQAQPEDCTYLVLHYDKYEKIWIDTDGLFKTIEEAKDEIRCIVDAYDDNNVYEEYFIVPNDFKKLRAFRPLDYGDVIYTSKPTGKPEDHIIEPGWWKK